MNGNSFRRDASKGKVMLRAVFSLVVLSMVWFVPGAFALDESIQEEVVAMIEMEVVVKNEYLFMAGDPPTQAHISWEGGYRHTGLWTFARLKGGQGYFMSPGRRDDPQMPYAAGPTVVGSHTCINGEGFVMGDRVFQISVKNVRAAWPEISDAGGGKFWMFVGVPEFTVDPPTGWSGASGECPAFHPEMGGCVNGPPYPRRGPYVEHGRLPEAAVIDWSALVATAQGNGTSISFGFEYQEQTEGEDPPGYPTSDTTTYLVRGKIHPEDWLDLEPLVD